MSIGNEFPGSPLKAANAERFWPDVRSTLGFCDRLLNTEKFFILNSDVNLCRIVYEPKVWPLLLHWHISLQNQNCTSCRSGEVLTGIICYITGKHIAVSYPEKVTF